MNKRAFSLVEVLVVIFIMCILAALLFPVFSSTKERAKQTVCVSNLRQIYAAMKMYESDNDGYPFSTEASSLVPTYLSTGLYCYNPFDPRMKGEYLLYGRPRANGLYVKEYEACRDLRGTDFPVAADSNHGDLKTGYSTSQRFFLLVREAGNVARVPAKKFTDMMQGGNTKPPCDLHLFMANL